MVADKHATRQIAAKAQHNRELSAYFDQKAKFDTVYRDWSNRKHEFTKAHSFSWVAGLVGTISFYSMGEDIGKGIGILATAIALFLWVVFSLRWSNRRDREFRLIYPEPTFKASYPTSPTITPVSHRPHFDQMWAGQSYDREEILRRDNLTCQICGHKKQRKNLEVHHIIPRAKGGTDSIENLVTLCKHCHDREDWYEHVRAYPTTIKGSVRRGNWRRQK